MTEMKSDTPITYSKALANMKIRTLEKELATTKQQLIEAQAYGKNLTEEINRINGCIEAAYLEGLADQIVELPDGEVGSLKDLVVRRLLYIDNHVQAALALQPNTACLDAYVRGVCGKPVIGKLFIEPRGTHYYAVCLRDGSGKGYQIIGHPTEAEALAFIESCRAKPTEVTGDADALDARRYRMMRQFCVDDGVPYPVCNATTNDEMDAAIDAAILASPSQDAEVGKLKGDA